MSENNLSEASESSPSLAESFQKPGDDFLSHDDFAAEVGLTRQGVTYHLYSGRLKPHAATGKVLKVGRNNYIHKDLIRLFPSKDEDRGSEKEQKTAASLPTASAISVSDITELYERLKENYETRLTDYESRLKDKDALIETLRQQNQSLNFQIEASNSAIQRYKSQEQILEEIQASMKALKDEVKKPPGWMFWKK